MMLFLLLTFLIVCAAAYWSGVLRAMALVAAVLHELGHWLTAKALGIYAPIFSLAPFEKPGRAYLRAFGTEFRYSTEWVDGRYVCVVDRDMPPEWIAEIEEATGIPMPRPPVVPWWQQVLIGAAGPLVNVILAITFFTWDYSLLSAPGELGMWLAMFASLLALFGILNARAAIYELYPRRGSDGWKIIRDFLNRHQQ
jgi:Zn-dependent protease